MNWLRNMLWDNKISYEIHGNLFVLKFNLITPNVVSIRNNALSIPGASFLLINIYADNFNVIQVIDLINNKITECKHCLDMPYDKSIDGVLLSDVLKYLGVNKNIRLDCFGVNVNYDLTKITNKNNHKYIYIDEHDYNSEKYIYDHYNL